MQTGSIVPYSIVSFTIVNRTIVNGYTCAYAPANNACVADPTQAVTERR